MTIKTNRAIFNVTDGADELSIFWDADPQGRLSKLEVWLFVRNGVRIYTIENEKLNYKPCVTHAKQLVSLVLGGHCKTTKVLTGKRRLEIVSD